MRSGTQQDPTAARPPKEDLLVACPRSYHDFMAAAPQMQVEVLLIDDDEGLRNTMYNWLSQMGMKVDVAATGLHAIQKLRANPSFHVVVSDIKMPGLNGLATIKKFKDEVPAFKGKVIMMSGHASPEHIKESKSLGAFAFLVKPFKPQDLFDKIVQAAGLPPTSPG